MFRENRITPAGWIFSSTFLSSALIANPGRPTTRGIDSVFIAHQHAKFGEEIKGLEWCYAIQFETTETIGDFLDRRAEEVELVDSFGGCGGRVVDHGITGDVELVTFEIGENLLCSATDLFRDPGEASDVYSVRVVCGALDHPVKEENRSSPFLHRHRPIDQTGKQACEVGELMVVSGEEDQSGVIPAVMKVLDDRPGE
jgi:hypothetical protein